MSFSAVGQVFDAATFRDHVAKLDLSWAKGVTLHHTGSPDLSMRPKGWTIQHMRNLADFYGNQLHWSAGPHLFTDEDQVFGLSPLTARGVHAVSFNAHFIGIEALGDYDREDPLSGRGLEVWQMTAKIVAILLVRMGLDVTDETLKFHRDDPKTSKSCPGTKVKKPWIIGMIEREMQEERKIRDSIDRIDPEPDAPEPPQTTFPKTLLLGAVEAIEWQLKKIRDLLA